MTRIVRDPKSLNSKNPEEVKRILIDMWALISEATLTITKDYTTTGKVAIERLKLKNKVDITVKLDDGPADGDQVQFKRLGEQVTIDGNGKTIDGEDELILGSKYDAVLLEYTGTEWSIMSAYFVFTKNSAGEVIVSDNATTEAIIELNSNIRLLNERFEEAFETLITKEDILE